MKAHITALFILLATYCNSSDVKALSTGLISDTVDVTNYEIRLSIMNFAAKQLSGYAILSVTPRMNNISHIPLDFLQLEVDSVKVDGMPVNSWYYNDTLLRVPLGTAINIGDTIKLKIRYHGTPVIEPGNWGGFHFSSTLAYNLGIAFEADPHNYGRVWFPGVDDFIDRATYDYYITTENDKMAVCGGSFAGVTSNPDNTKTWHWRMNQTIPAYLASVAVSNYSELADIYNGMNGGVPIGLHFRPSDTASAKALFTNLKDILATYENHWGPYPFDRVGFCGTTQGAMEHASNVAYPTSSLSISDEWLYAHELSHMWFGDKITCSTPEDMWINEGWATFNELLFREGLYGTESYRTTYNDKLRNVLQFCHFKDGGYRALFGIPNEYTYGETVYQKGSLVVHSLRNYLGDAAFFPAMTNFLNDYGFQPVSSVQMRDYLTLKTGVNMNRFFDSWVFSPGFPGFVIDSCYLGHACNQIVATVYMQQKLKGTTDFYNDNHMDVTFIDSLMNTFTVSMNFSGQYGSQTFNLPFWPAFCMADYYDKVADATTDYSYRFKQTGDLDFKQIYFLATVNTCPDSAFMRVTHNWTAPDPLKIPEPGLKLSDYRYWRIDGIFPEGFSAKGRFFYSKASHLDDSLFQNPDDSLVMLYRESPAKNWHAVPFTRLGSTTGYIYVDNLKAGEYTLASWDAAYVGIAGNETETMNRLSVSPNPSSGKFNILYKTNAPAELKIYGSEGRLVYQTNVSKGNGTIQWVPAGLKSGIYYMHIENGQKQTLAIAKAILTK
jgi:aminopeptidase N